MASRNIIWWIFYILFVIIRGTFAKENSHPDTNCLSDFFHDYARKVEKMPRTGKFYDISLQSNYSGIKISYIQIRTASLWTRGIHSNAVHIPPKTRILPFVKRLDIVFEDLCNLSSYYYNVPNHSFVTPVFGFAIYNGEGNSSTLPNLCLEGNSTILIQFPDISVKKGENATLIKCVRFGANGEIEFSNVTVPNRCHVTKQGHFSIVVPSSKHSNSNNDRRKRLAIGLGVGIGVLVLLFIVILMCRFARKKKIEGMQSEAEKGERLDPVSVGGWSRMPSARWNRSVNLPENDYIP